jgi:hypothetical protein
MDSSSNVWFYNNTGQELMPMIFIQGAFPVLRLATYDQSRSLGIDYDGYVDANFPKVVGVPDSSSATGVMGTISYDNSYLYICTSTNKWGRTELDYGF